MISYSPIPIGICQYVKKFRITKSILVHVSNKLIEGIVSPS